MNSNKPPDEYKIIKHQLNKIMLKPEYTEKILDAVIRTDKITIKTYMLIYLFGLVQYEIVKLLSKDELNHFEIPINDDLIYSAQKSIMKSSAGPKPKGETADFIRVFTELQEFIPKFNEITLDKSGDEKVVKEDGLHLSQVLQYQSTEMITAIENNIKLHYLEHYITRYINSVFGLKSSSNKKELRKELNKVKNDIVKDNKVLTSDEKYHKWINKNRYFIVPREYEKSYYYDITINPQKYLSHMFYVNEKLEELGVKLYQVIPIRSDCVLKNIHIDTKTLVELFIEEDKNKYLKNITDYRDEIWNKFTTIKRHINKGYTFDYTILTDAFSVSIRYIEPSKLVKQDKKKDNMRKARKLKNKEEDKIIDEAIKDVEKGKIKTEGESKISKQAEFLYIDEVDYKLLENCNAVFCDPGKRSLFYMKNKAGDIYNYTNKKRLRFSNRITYQTKIQKSKDDLGISEIEKELCDYVSKSCTIEKFTKYCSKKLELNKVLMPKYMTKVFRQYKWYSFISRKRCEDKMLNEIERTFGKDAVIIMGDASIGVSMRNFISTPNIHIKKKIKGQNYSIIRRRIQKFMYKL